MVSTKTIKKIAAEYTKRLGRKIRIEKVILTGSFASGTHLDDSDVDLIVVSPDFEKMSFKDRLVFLQDHWKSSLPLEAFGYAPRELLRLKRSSTYVRDALDHGIDIT